MADERREGESAVCPECKENVPGKGGGSCTSCRRRSRRAQERETDEGVVDLTVMRKVLGQGRLVDKGPTERRLREWLAKDPKGYVAEMDRREGRDEEVKVLRELVRKLEAREDELEAEVERLGREGGTKNVPPAPGPDLGSERVGFDVAELLRAGVAGEGMPALVMALANRVADQSELLSRRSERVEPR